MYSANWDEKTKLLHLTYSGPVDTRQTKACVAELEALLPKLTAGFRLLSDLTSLDAMDWDCVADVRRMMDLCNQKQVSLVVRVIPDPHKDIGLNILSLFHYDRKVRLVTCQTLDEALKVLAA